MIVFCVSHAEPVNWKSLPKGTISRLTEAGRIYAQAAGDQLTLLLREKLKDAADQVRLKRVFSSPATKCLETAIELCKMINHSIVDFTPNHEFLIHDDLLASKGQQVSQATMDALLQKIRDIEAMEEGADSEPAYLICGHADLAAITPDRELLGKIEHKLLAANREEWNFQCQPTLVLLRCDLQGKWSSVQLMGALAFEAGTWVPLK